MGRILAVATRKAASARRRQPSTWARPSRSPTSACSSSTPTRNATSRAASPQGPERPAGDIYDALMAEDVATAPPSSFDKRFGLLRSRPTATSRARNRARAHAAPRSAAPPHHRPAARPLRLHPHRLPRRSGCSRSTHCGLRRRAHPAHCEYFASKASPTSWYPQARPRRAQSSLDIDGVLLTMYDERTNLGSRCRATCARSSRRSVPHRHPAQRAPRRGAQPRHAVILYDVKSRGCRGLPRLAREMLTRNGRGRTPRRPRTEGHHGRETTRARQGTRRADRRRLEGTGRTPARPSRSTSTAWRQQLQPRSRTEERASTSWRSPSGPTASSSRFSCARRAAATRIIAGERRWHAAQRAGLLKVPITVRDVARAGPETLEWALREPPSART